MKPILLLGVSAAFALTVLAVMSQLPIDEEASGPLERSPRRSGNAPRSEARTSPEPTQSVSRPGSGEERTPGGDEAPASSREGEEAGSGDGPAASERLEAELAGLFSAALDDTPPDLATLDPVLEKLARRVEIDPSSVVRDEASGDFSAKLSIPGTPFQGEVRGNGDRARVGLQVASADPDDLHLARELSVNLNFDGPLAVSGGASIQHHPKTEKPSTGFLEPDQVITCGWSYDVSEGDTRLHPIEAAPADEGGGWKIGRLRPELRRTMKGAYNLKPYDAWAAKLSKALGHP